MIKVLITLCLIVFANQGLCGVTVLGTRFEMNDDAKLLNIKVSNDNENDYIIKSNSDDDNIIITPPLFLLKKDSSNLITLIPKVRKKNSEDKIINLTITAIPKSIDTGGSNSVSMAVRNHFKIIYRHGDIDESSYEKLKIIDQKNDCVLKNNSRFVFTVSLADKKGENSGNIFNIRPSESVTLGDKNSSVCNSWVNFHDQYNDIAKSIIPSRVR